ncbi:MAG: type VI secretion system tip protein VgrG [Bernardetiaceae bacterium]|nr:type VI secretion system tip protein VgrG [Bernardetiaceae bacterium]
MADYAKLKGTVVTYKIKINGSEINGSYGVYAIETGKAVNKISYARIEIADGDATGPGFKIAAQSEFKPGADIEIKVGYDAKSEKTIYKGMIVKIGAKVSPYEDARFVLECRDKVIKKTLERKIIEHLKKKDSDIIQGALSGHSPSVKATSYTHPYLLQYNVTDWDFTLMRAEANGMIVLVDDGEVTVGPPKTSSASVKAGFGVNIYSMDIEVDTSFAIKKAKGYAWDFSTQKMATASGTDPNLNAGSNVSNSDAQKALGNAEYEAFSGGFMKEAELKAWSEGKLVKSQLSKFRGKIELYGSANLKIGDMIELSDMGARFNGKAFVGAVIQRIEDGSWKTEVHLGMDFEWHYEKETQALAPPAHGLLGAVHGLQVGVVKNIHKDPDNEYRVLVKLANLGEGVWARMSTFYATNGQGIFFMPEEDDEVVVGFVDADPRFPIILGSMYSSKNKPDEKPVASNDIKAILTKAKLKIEFDDKDKILTIITPAENQVVLDDKKGSVTIEDKNGHTITLDSKGITLKSAMGKDITIDSAGKIDIKAMQAIAIASTSGNVEIEGLSVKAEAKTKIELSGNAGAELKSTGITDVKGSLVNIN